MLLQIMLCVTVVAASGVIYSAPRTVTGRPSPAARGLATYRIDRTVRRETRDLDRPYAELPLRH